MFSYVGCADYGSQTGGGAPITQQDGSDDKESETEKYKVTLKNSDGVIFDESVVSYGSKIT